MANNLKDHLKEVADAIRAKKGTSDLINPQDFATEIEGISGGSGEGENGEFTMEYYDFNAIATAANAPISSIMQFMTSLLSAGVYLLVKANDTILPLHSYSLEEIANLTPSAISILYGTRTILNEENDIVWTSVEMDKKTNGMYSMFFAPNKITKEQFYDLNA